VNRGYNASIPGKAGIQNYEIERTIGSIVRLIKKLRFIIQEEKDFTIEKSLKRMAGK
jgi:hypothetical protein